MIHGFLILTAANEGIEHQEQTYNDEVNERDKVALLVLVHSDSNLECNSIFSNLTAIIKLMTLVQIIASRSNLGDRWRFVIPCRLWKISYFGKVWIHDKHLIREGVRVWYNTVYYVRICTESLLWSTVWCRCCGVTWDSQVKTIHCFSILTTGRKVLSIKSIKL